MNKQEYMERLAHHLGYYQGDHAELLSNYDSIIDELIDEGLTMDDVIQKLGRPAVLAEEIAEEFDLPMTEQMRKSTTMPSWAKTLLIVVGLIILVPSLLSIVLGAVGTLLSISIGMIAFLFGGVFTTASIWAIPTLTPLFKVVTTITALAAIVSSLIITYFALYWGSHLFKWLLKKSKELMKGSV